MPQAPQTSRVCYRGASGRLDPDRFASNYGISVFARGEPKSDKHECGEIPGAPTDGGQEIKTAQWLRLKVDRLSICCDLAAHCDRLNSQINPWYLVPKRADSEFSSRMHADYEYYPRGLVK